MAVAQSNAEVLNRIEQSLRQLAPRPDPRINAISEQLGVLQAQQQRQAVAAVAAATQAQEAREQDVLALRGNIEGATQHLERLIGTEAGTEGEVRSLHEQLATIERTLEDLTAVGPAPADIRGMRRQLQNLQAIADQVRDAQRGTDAEREALWQELQGVRAQLADMSNRHGADQLAAATAAEEQASTARRLEQQLGELRREVQRLPVGQPGPSGPVAQPGLTDADRAQLQGMLQQAQELNRNVTTGAAERWALQQQLTALSAALEQATAVAARTGQQTVELAELQQQALDVSDQRDQRGLREQRRHAQESTAMQQQLVLQAAEMQAVNEQARVDVAREQARLVALVDGVAQGQREQLVALDAIDAGMREQQRAVAAMEQIAQQADQDRRRDPAGIGIPPPVAAIPGAVGFAPVVAPVGPVPAAVPPAAVPPAAPVANEPTDLQKEYQSKARRYTHVPAQDYFRSTHAIPVRGLPRGYYEYSQPQVEEEQIPDWAERV